MLQRVHVPSAPVPPAHVSIKACSGAITVLPARIVLNGQVSTFRRFAEKCGPPLLYNLATVSLRVEKMTAAHLLATHPVQPACILVMVPPAISSARFDARTSTSLVAPRRRWADLGGCCSAG